MHKSKEWEDVLQSEVDEYGNTIAHLAAESGNVQVFKVRVSAEMQVLACLIHVGIASSL